MMITLPVVYPLIISLGFDGIWFAVMVTLNMEIALISPPVGLNLYVIMGLCKTSLANVVKGVIPYFVIMVIALFIIAFWVPLSTWLPSFVVAR
jgi:C4-dicarboxylate transporter DctM subunit